MTTLAGAPFVAGFANGVGNAARFTRPTAAASSPSNAAHVYVCDTGNNAIRVVDTTTGNVSTVATSVMKPLSLAVGVSAGVDVLYVVVQNNSIVRIDSSTGPFGRKEGGRGACFHSD